MPDSRPGPVANPPEPRSVAGIETEAEALGESLRLGDFTQVETLALLGQRTAETGQAFTDYVVESPRPDALAAEQATKSR